MGNVRLVCWGSYSLAFAALISLVGCGPDLSHLPKTVTAEGVVTLDGQPVEGASVNFVSESTSYHASGVTDSNGHFSLRAFEEKPGAVPGEYRVTVNKTLVSETGGGEDENSIGEVNVQYGLPKKYAALGTSGLSATIPEEGTTDLKIELTSE
ncbi:MAG: hypothetical protein KatS3mg111_2129 [Pirellulaceae bacterium]|nr:MAG: hypothetical protein KatS3mg111_2129 [Pirellulaceae bacterium]